MTDPALEALARRVRDLERQLEQIPARVANPQTVYRNLLMGRGNTLATFGSDVRYGLRTAASLTAVPTAAPIAGTAYANGLAYAVDRGNGFIPSETGALVWITAAGSVTTDNGAVGTVVRPNAAQYVIPEGTPILAVASFLVPVTGAPGTFAVVYQPTYIGG